MRKYGNYKFAASPIIKEPHHSLYFSIELTALKLSDDQRRRMQDWMRRQLEIYKTKRARENRPEPDSQK